MPQRRNMSSSDTEWAAGPVAKNGHSLMPDLDALPEYPQFTSLERDHRVLLEQTFRAIPPRISEFTFAYQWTWRPYTRCRLARIQGSIVLLTDVPSNGGSQMLPPITPTDEEAAALITAALKEGSSIPTDSFGRVPKALAEQVAMRMGVIITEEPQRADYIYSADVLRKLPGRRFQRKRTHIQRFWRAFPGAEYRDMDASLAGECATFSRRWLESHPNRDLAGLQREVKTTVDMLSDYQSLGLRGGVMVAEGRVVAFALGEPLNPDTFVVRVEKADASLPGAYTVMNQEFARRGAAGFKWINREQDLGIPGLRRAKRSYYPDHLVRKYRVKLA